MRPAMPSSACSAAARPKRASHAAGIGSSFTMVPMATPSAIAAPRAPYSRTSKVSVPSSWLSLKIPTQNRFSVSPGRKWRDHSARRKSCPSRADAGVDSRAR